MTPARRKPSPSSPGTDPAPPAGRPPARQPGISRAEALRWWRAGDEAGLQAAEHEHHAAAQWDRHAGTFRAQRAAGQQAKLDALLQETIAALASLFTDDPGSPPA